MNGAQEELLLTKFCEAFDANDSMTVRKILFFDLNFRNCSNSKFKVENRILCTKNKHGVKKEIVELLVRFLEFEAVSRTSGSLNEQLKIAIMRGDLQRAESLFKKGATLRGPEWKKKSSGAFVFSVANTSGTRKEMLLLLLKHGIQAATKDEPFPLYKYLIDYVNKNDAHDYLEMAKILFDHGVPINESKYCITLPIFYFTYCKIDYRIRIKLLSFLIDKGADVNSQDEITQYTPLHYAAYKGDPKVIRFLINNGADTKFLDALDKTPFYTRLSFSQNPDLGARQFIREFSRLNIEGLSISEIDMKLLRADPILKEYFEHCTKELEQMKSYKFYEFYTYYCVLKMSRNIKKLARLTKNGEFVAKFEANLSEFDCYKSDLEDLLADAVEVRDKQDAAKLKLYQVFDTAFPDLVISRFADFLALDDF